MSLFPRACLTSWICEYLIILIIFQIFQKSKKKKKGKICYFNDYNIKKQPSFLRFGEVEKRHFTRVTELGGSTLLISGKPLRKDHGSYGVWGSKSSL